MSVKVLIIGNGIVGHNLRNELKELSPDVYDKYNRDENSERTDYLYDLAFVCVPTPYRDKENPCDVTEVESAIKEHNAIVYVIKSAILPGTVEKLQESTGKRIVVSPEYYGSTVHANSYKYDFTILGGDRKDCLYVIQILQYCYSGEHKFKMTNAKTAELVKYMENSWIATKISFCSQFWSIANQIGVDYPELRELFLLDPRVNASHTFIFDSHPFWDSECLNKDVPAIADTYDARMLKGVIEFNKEVMNNE